MTTNFDNLWPLYKISVQYRQLSLADAEIETLKLLAQVCCSVWINNNTQCCKYCVEWSKIC